TVGATVSGANQRTTILWRYATGGDPGDWTFTTRGGATTSTGAMRAYRGTGGTTPALDTATGTAASGTTHPVPEVTTTGDATLVVSAAGFPASTTGTSASGWAARATVAAGASLLVSDYSQTDPGQSPTVDVTTPGATTSASVTLGIGAVTTDARLGYGGHSDNPSFTTTAAGTVLADYTIPLMGGALFTYNATDGYGITHTNWHGDAYAVTDLLGDRVWEGLTGPHGEQASTTIPFNTGTDGTRWGWHGEDQRLTDR